MEIFFIHSLEACGLVLFLRGAASVLDPWFLTRKPLSCNLCCAWWASVMFGVVRGLNHMPLIELPSQVLVMMALVGAYLNAFWKQAGELKVLLPPAED